MAGLKWPWDDECDDEIVRGDRTWKLIDSHQDLNVATLVVVTVCTYQAQDNKPDITTERHVRVLWVFDF